MKRQRFRLGVVLRHYELQKQRAEQDLQQASLQMRNIEAEIDNLQVEIEALANHFAGTALNSLSTAGWLACGRRSEFLVRCLADAQSRLDRQLVIVAQCADQRKRWAVAEEMLLSLRHQVETANRAEADKLLQAQLQETILRGCLGDDTDRTPAV